MLGRYEVIRHLASGGMADLLLARARGLEGFERHVVIKRIRADAENDQAFIDMFLIEARLAGALHHHNIVQVHDIGEENGKPYFAMEYVHGEDLRRLLALVVEKGQQVPFPVVVTIVTAVARALHHAHEQRGADQQPLGIVHRDVSPANIVVGYDGNVKVLDFGIARAAMRRTETQAGMLKGKAPYMAPEQCTGAPVDRRSDVFGLGIVLYELVTARRLFKGDNDFSTMSMVVSGSFPRPSTIRKDLPPDLERMILRALAREPGSRYQTAEQMFVALEQLALTAEWRTSASALATYMQQMFGSRTEPWLEKAPAAAAITVDFDGARPGLATAPVDAGKSAVPAAIPPTRSSPMMLARADAEASTGVPGSIDAAVSSLIKIPEASGPVKNGKSAAPKPVPAQQTPARVKPRTVQVPLAKGDAKALDDTQVVLAMKSAKPDAPTEQLPTTKAAVSPDGDTDVLTVTKVTAEAEATTDIAAGESGESQFDDTQVVSMTESAALPVVQSAAKVATVEAKPAAGSGTVGKGEVKPATKVDPKLDAKPAAKIDAKPATKVDPKLDAKPAAKVDAKPATKVDPQLAAKVDAKPAAKVDAKPTAKIDAKPAAKVDAKPAAKVDAKPAASVIAKLQTPAKPLAKLPPTQDAKADPKPRAETETESVTNPIIEPEETHTDAMAMPPASSPHAPRPPRSLPPPNVAKSIAAQPGVPDAPPSTSAAPAAPTRPAAGTSPVTDRAITSVGEDPLDAITATATDLDDTVMSASEVFSTTTQRSDPTAIVVPLPSPMITDSPRARRSSTVPVDQTMRVDDTDQRVAETRPRWFLPALGAGVLVLLILVITIAFSGGDDDLETRADTATVTEPTRAEPTAAPAPAPASDDVRTEARPRTWANSQQPETVDPATTAEPPPVAEPAVTAEPAGPTTATKPPTQPPPLSTDPTDPDLRANDATRQPLGIAETSAPTPAAIAKTPTPAPKPAAIAKTPAPKAAAIAKTPAPRAAAIAKPVRKPAAIAKKPASRPAIARTPKPAAKPAPPPLPKPKWNPNSLFPNKK